MTAEDVDQLLLRRRQSVCLAPAPAGTGASGGARTRTAEGLTALDAELATRGFLLTAPLRQALGALPLPALAERGRRLLAGVDGLLGADRVHIPLFRHFPEPVPYEHAHTLYTARIQAHLAFQPHQPCMVCGLAGSLVAPIRGCGHLVCRTCWVEAPSACCAECCTWRDCPVCEERVGTDGPSSPWSALPARRTGAPAGAGSPLLRVLRFEPSRASAARQELAALLARRTPLSPQDHDDLSVLLTYIVLEDGGGDGGVAEWLPAEIPLPTEAICALIEAELLDRLAASDPVPDTAEGAADDTAYDAAVLDAGLTDLPVPTAERGVAASLAAIPRGSSLPMPRDGERVRLFLHWRQPTGLRVDLDLSVGMYDAEWRFVGLCDYTRLEYAGGAALHSGDLTSAPGPHGATEYVDLDLPRLAGAGVRHLVVAVLSYNDVPFEELPDAFAGFMEVGAERAEDARPGRPPRRTRRQVRKDTARERTRYDARTVRQRFDLTGDAKIRIPMTVDLSTRRALWADVTLASGAGGHHNVWSYRTRMARMARDLSDAFAPGTRVTLWDLACWHAAARTRPGAPVFVREGRGLRTYRRRAGESAHGFAVRLREDWAPDSSLPAAEPPLTAAGQIFSALVHADLAVPPTATGTAYRLYPGGADATAQRLVSAGDLVAELAPRTG